MGEITDKICLERMDRLSERVDICDKRLDVHSKDIDELKQYRSRTETKIENLCDQIKNLVTTMRWFMGLFASSLIGFFIWYIQNIGR